MILKYRLEDEGGVSEISAVNEAEDRDNNCYTPNFYEVKEVE